MMDRFKICPECGEKNPPNITECLKCDCDLMGVSVTNDSQEKVSPIQAGGCACVNEQTFRICSECGERNLPNARKCANCGEDISDITPTAADIAVTQRNAETRFVLCDIDGKELLTINKSIIVIGRQNELQDYLSDKSYVSRKHCRLLSEEGSLYIEDLGSSNSTYVNNEIVTEKTRLNKGDEISLGGNMADGKRQNKAAYFLLR